MHQRPICLLVRNLFNGSCCWVSESVAWLVMRAQMLNDPSQALVEATPADILLLYPHVLLTCFALLALPSVTVFAPAVDVLSAV